MPTPDSGAQAGLGPQRKKDRLTQIKYVAIGHSIFEAPITAARTHHFDGANFEKGHGGRIRPRRPSSQVGREGLCWHSTRMRPSSRREMRRTRSSTSRKAASKVVVLSEQEQRRWSKRFRPGQFFHGGEQDGSRLRISTTTTLEVRDAPPLRRPLCLRPSQQATIRRALHVSYLLKRNGRIEEDLIDQLFISSEATGAAAAAVSLWQGMEASSRSRFASAGKRWRI